MSPLRQSLWPKIGAASTRARRAYGHGAGPLFPLLRARQAPCTIEEVMTPAPLTIGRGQTLAKAHEMMNARGIHHLPVLEHGDLVGVVSERDLYLLETIAGIDREVDRVEDAMSFDTYAVAPSVPLDAVARTMACERYECAVVMERGRVIGIFTSTDALRLLAES